MSKLSLSYGGLLYLDRTLGLYTGDVVPQGIDLTYVAFPSPGDLFRRQAQFAEFDVCEMSSSTYLVMVSRGDDRLVGLPIFVSRNFRHGQVYVHEGAGIREPSDLRGKRVGVVEYQITAALWIRAFLEHDHGVRPEDLTWFEGGLIVPDWAERLAVELPSGVEVRRIPAGKTLEGMLAAGELDALVTMQPPQGFDPNGGPVRRLFPDHPVVEREYYQRTGLFPIMHMVVMRRDVYERNRWAALSLYDAFVKAKQAGAERLRAVTGLAVSLPWLSPAIEEVDAIFGGDAFPYGVERNRHVLDALATYAFEQGLASRKVEVEELFAAETYQEPIPL
jgi:4,5-dihydroxyphthalate decarboxylase